MAADAKLRLRLYFNFNREYDEYGPYPMHYFSSKLGFLKKINGTDVPDPGYYLDQSTTTEIQQLYLTNKITLSTPYTIQSIPDDEKYDILTTDKEDAQCIQQGLFVTASDENAEEQKVDCIFLESCLLWAELSRHSDSIIYFGINHKIWTVILKYIPYLYLTDYVIIGIKIAWCFTSYWYLIFVDIAVTVIANLFTGSFDAHTVQDHIVNVFMVLVDSTQVLYGCIYDYSRTCAWVTTQLLRPKYFQNSCSTFVNQNPFICEQSQNPEIIAFFKNVNHHILNVVLGNLLRFYLKNFREEEDADTERIARIDECDATVKEAVAAYENCLRSSHKTTHQIFRRCHCSDHSFEYRKDADIDALHACYFTFKSFPKWFGAVLIVYLSFYIIGVFVQSVMQTEFSVTWALILAVCLYTRLFVNFLMFACHVGWIYAQGYYFQLHGLKKMDMYWLDPRLDDMFWFDLQSDMALHFTLNGYCDYMRYAMANYLICCLLYGLKIHDSDCLLSSISFSSIDTILEYLNDNEPPSLKWRIYEKDKCVENIQNAQQWVVEQFERVRDVITQKRDTYRIDMATHHTHNTSDDECIHIMALCDEESKHDTDDTDAEDDSVPTILEFQRAACIIHRFNNATTWDLKRIFRGLRGIALDPYGTVKGVIDLDDDQKNSQKKPLRTCEGLVAFLKLTGFRSDESGRFLMFQAPSKEGQMNAVFALNGFLDPIFLEEEPQILTDVTPNIAVVQWEFSSPNTKTHHVQLTHAQSETLQSKRVISVDDCVYFDDETSATSFNIEIDDILAVIRIEKLDPMWSDEPYKYDLVLDKDRYMKTFELWESKVFESVIGDIPSLKELNDLYESLMYHKSIHAEYNKMMDLSVLEHGESVEAMERHHKKWKEIETEYVKHMKNVHRLYIEYQETVLLVYGFVKECEGHMLPTKIQDLCVHYIIAKHQISPDVLRLIDSFQIIKRLRLTTYGFIRKYGGSMIPDWVRNVCVSYVGERHFC